MLACMFVMPAFLLSLLSGNTTFQIWLQIVKSGLDVSAMEQGVCKELFLWLHEWWYEMRERNYPGNAVVSGAQDWTRILKDWRGLDKNIEGLSKSGQQCQSVKQAPPAAPMHP